MSDITLMLLLPTLHRRHAARWGRRTTTLSDSINLRTRVCPPSLVNTPGSLWNRLLFWLLAPSPQDASPPLNRLPGVRIDFLATLADIDSGEADRVRERIAKSPSLRELWHLRAEIYRVVGLVHSQGEAEQRLALLNRHFPTRAPRSQFVPL